MRRPSARARCWRSPCRSAVASRQSRAVTVVSRRSPSRQSARLDLTLDDAIARGLATSHRLAEAAARGDAASAVADRAPRGAAAAAGGAGRLHAHQPRRGVRDPAAEQPAQDHLPRHSRQLPDAARSAVADLHRRPARRARAGGPHGGRGVRRRSRRRARDLRLEITRAYWALVTAAESLRVVDESVPRVDAHLRDVRNQLDAGLDSAQRRVERRGAGIAAADAEHSGAVHARRRRSRARQADWRAAGHADPAGVRAGRAAVAGCGGAGALVEQAKQDRAERAGLAKRVDAAGVRREAAAAGAKPTIAFGGGVDYARPNPRIFPREAAWRDSWDASINVSWPLFDGGRTRAELAEARATARAAEERLADFDATLAVEVRQRLSELESSRAAIDGGIRRGPRRRRSGARRRQSFHRRRRDQHRRARRAGRAPAGRARSHAGDRQRAARGRAPRAHRALGK